MKSTQTYMLVFY